MKSKQFFIYILTNFSNRVFYTGVTNNLIRRSFEHRDVSIQGFTSRYNVTKLVYYEIFTDIRGAITREKQIKGGSRKKKFDLITSMNPTFEDLFDKII